FIPLAFWEGVIGSFMFFLPITLIITLLASLLVAYIINPVFAVDFMKPHDHENPHARRKWGKKDKITLIIFASIAAICYLSAAWGIGNFIVFIYLFIVLEKFVFSIWLYTFQTRTWPAFQN